MPQEVYSGFQVTRMIEWGKSQPKKIPRASYKTTKKNPTQGWVLDPEDLKRKIGDFEQST